MLLKRIKSVLKTLVIEPSIMASIKNLSDSILFQTDFANKQLSGVNYVAFCGENKVPYFTKKLKPISSNQTCLLLLQFLLKL